MNWKLILPLTLIGALMGYATLYIHSMKGEQLLWLLAFLISALVLGFYTDRKLFLTGLLTGILQIALAMAIHISFVKIYFLHHEEIAALANQNAKSMSPVVVIMLLDIFKGLFMAAISGLFALVIGNGLHRSLNR